MIVARGARAGSCALWACIAVFLGFFAATPAVAQSESVSIDVIARISSRCGFAAGDLPSLTASADLEEPGQLLANVELDCNTPYAFGITAAHGALVNIDARDDESGFAFAKTYRVAVALDTDQGVVRSQPCSSADLIEGGSCAFAASRPGEGFSSGPGISIGRRATLTIDWPPQSALPSRLAAGRYKDTLILVVGARA